MGLLTVRRGVVGLILLTGLVYAGSLGGPFIWDDEIIYIDNPHILNETVKTAFTRDLYAHIGKANRYYHYRPVALLAYSWMARVFHLQPFFLHLASLAVHAAAGVLVFFLVLELAPFQLPWATGHSGKKDILPGAGRSPSQEQEVGTALADMPVAWVTAALFVVHPLHAEPVAWMVAFGEVLAGALFLLSLFGLLRSQRGSKVWMAVSCLAALLSFLTKETSLGLPLVAAVFVGWRAWPYFAIAGACLVMRYLVMGFAAAPALPMALGGRISLTAAAAWHFTKKLIWPYPMAVQYDLRYPSAIAWACFAALCALAAVAAYRHPRVRLALLLLVFPLLPALGLSSFLPLGHNAQDRNAYVAVLGFTLLVGYSASRRAGAAASLALVALWSALTVAALRPWREQETFWKHTLQVTPNSKPAVMNLGYWYFITHRFDEAERAYEHGLMYKPNDKELLFNLEQVRKVRNPLRPPGPARARLN